MKTAADNSFWWNIALTWGTVIVVLLGIALILLFSGCEMLREHQDEIRDRIITCIETRGRAKAEQYIDDLVERGELTQKQADRIKAAIPKGIDKVKEVLDAKKRDRHRRAIEHAYCSSAGG